uniref:Uncharacterized protein n=1 Tax=Romanomermis culicivorax TaxID=13658 RepID=A0A915KPK7_ROMCU
MIKKPKNCGETNSVKNCEKRQDMKTWLKNDQTSKKNLEKQKKLKNDKTKEIKQKEKAENNLKKITRIIILCVLQNG